MSEATEAVIRRIQKLMALGHRGGTEAEAAAAMDMAQELLAKYNLDMAVIQNTAVEGGTVAPKEKRERTKINKSAMYAWQQQLCGAIAECNFCYYWALDFWEQYTSKGEVKDRRVKRHMIVGREVNVVAVTYMYEYLAETLEDLLPYSNKDRLCKSAINWREGCADRLRTRIRQKFQDMQAASESPTKAQSHGVVLRSVFQAEYRANFDAICGEGSYDEALAQMTRTQQAETEEQKAARKKKEDKEWTKKQKEYQRKWNSKDHAAYLKGREAGDSISLQDRIKS